MLIGPFKWRVVGVFLSIFFHLCNKLIFNIGIFPWMCLIATTLFFDPDWPRMRWLRFGRSARENPVPLRGDDTEQDGAGKQDAVTREEEPTTDSHVQRQTGWEPRGCLPSLTLKQKAILLCLGIYLGCQIYLPVRYLWYPGDVAWTEYGHKFAWRMKLREKLCSPEIWLSGGDSSRHGSDIGIIREDREGRRMVEIAHYLRTRSQQVTVSVRPELLHQFAHWLADQEMQAVHEDHTKNGTAAISRPRVHADVWCNINFRRDGEHPFIDPDVDLAAEKLWEWPYKAVLESPTLSREDELDLPWNWDWYDLLWGEQKILKHLASFQR